MADKKDFEKLDKLDKQIDEIEQTLDDLAIILEDDEDGNLDSIRDQVMQKQMQNAKQTTKQDPINSNAPEDDGEDDHNDQPKDTESYSQDEIEDEDDDYEPQQKKRNQAKQKEPSNNDAADDVDSNNPDDLNNKADGDTPDKLNDKTDINEPSGRYGDTPPNQTGKPTSPTASPTSGATPTASPTTMGGSVGGGATAGSATGAAGAGATGAGAAGAGAGAAGATGAGMAGAGAAGAGAGAAGAGAAGAGAVIGGLGWVLIVILAIILIIVIISAISAWIEGKTSQDALKSNPYITSEHFYGLRTAYIDDDALSDALQLSYKQYVVDIIESVTDDGTIELSVTLPAGDFTNTTEIDNNIINMSLAIGNIVATGNSSYTGIDNFLVDLYPNIHYFGLTDTNRQKVTEFLKTYLTSKLTREDSSLSTAIDTAVSDLTYMTKLYQKVMIKDEIATDSGLYNLEPRKFVGSVYMANTNTSLTGLSYVINNQNADRTATAKLISYANDTETILMDESIDKNGNDINVVTPSNNEALSLTPFESIDPEDTSLFSAGVSLFEAMRLTDGKMYFREQTFTTDAGELVMYTWKPADASSLYLEFTSNTRFMYGEFGLTAN